MADAEEGAVLAAVAALDLDAPTAFSAGGHTEEEHPSRTQKRRAQQKRAKDTRASCAGAPGSRPRRSRASSCRRTRRRASSRPSSTMPVRLVVFAAPSLVLIFYLTPIIFLQAVRTLSTKSLKHVVQARRTWSPSPVRRGCRPVKYEARHHLYLGGVGWQLRQAVRRH
jgi:hypothetical protein